MTIITETRWKCDYCGNVSPVIGFPGAPNGWVTDGIHAIDILHFCCKAHEVLWQQQQEKVTP